MSYLQFHLVFTVPPVLLLALLARGRLQRVEPRAGWFLALIALIAFVYTTPWDNYLVWRGVWGYGTERVLATIGYVPVEEYAFFVLQPLLTGLWTLLLLSRAPDAARPAGEASRWVGALVYALAAAAGVWLLGSEPGTYLGLILAWAAPVLALQWAYAGRAVWARRRVLVPAVALPTLYLWFADAVAIRLGIWEISRRYTLGPRPAGLPIEEATFFLVTNLLVVQGLVLFLYPPRGPRPAPRAATPAASTSSVSSSSARS